jgi:hypothetical protein
VNSRLIDDFRARFAKVPNSIQAGARKAYKLWQNDPSHPSLHFKRIHGSEQLYSVRVGLGWRVLGLRDGDTMTWFWIGSHAEYDRLIS